MNSENKIRAMLDRKDATGGWSEPGDAGAVSAPGCLVLNLSQVCGGTDNPDWIVCRLAILDAATEQHPGRWRGTPGLIDLHTDLSPEELDRVAEKAALKMEERV